MLYFEGVVNQSGVNPEGTFMAVPLGGVTLVRLRDAASASLALDSPYLVNLLLVTRDNSSRAYHALSAQFFNWGLGVEQTPDSRKGTYSIALSLASNFTPQTRLYQVTGKTRGKTRLRATAGRTTKTLEIAVVPQLNFTLGFRFLRHRDASRQAVSPVHYDPLTAQALVDQLNWVYGPQANISFSLEDADWADAPKPLSHPVSYLALLEIIGRWKYKSVDLNVFVVGGQHLQSNDGKIASGRYFGDLGENAIAVMDGTDNPSLADPFLTTVAHEIAHFLADEAGFDGDIHHDRPDVLLSTKVQSTRLDREVVLRLNPP
jgi:hypothetical protein